jgi:hypothetical protein
MWRRLISVKSITKFSNITSIGSTKLALNGCLQASKVLTRTTTREFTSSIIPRSPLPDVQKMRSIIQKEEQLRELEGKSNLRKFKFTEIYSFITERNITWHSFVCELDSRLKYYLKQSIQDNADREVYEIDKFNIIFRKIDKLITEIASVEFVKSRENPTKALTDEEKKLLLGLNEILCVSRKGIESFGNFLYWKSRYNRKEIGEWGELTCFRLVNDNKKPEKIEIVVNGLIADCQSLSHHLAGYEKFFACYIEDIKNDNVLGTKLSNQITCLRKEIKSLEQEEKAESLTR